MKIFLILLIYNCKINRKLEIQKYKSEKIDVYNQIREIMQK